MFGKRYHVKFVLPLIIWLGMDFSNIFLLTIKNVILYNLVKYLQFYLFLMQLIHVFYL